MHISSICGVFLFCFFFCYWNCKLSIMPQFFTKEPMGGKNQQITNLYHKEMQRNLPICKFSDRDTKTLLERRARQQIIFIPIKIWYWNCFCSLKKRNIIKSDNSFRGKGFFSAKRNNQKFNCVQLKCFIWPSLSLLHKKKVVSDWKKSMFIILFIVK